MDDQGTTSTKKQRVVYAIIEKPHLKKAVWMKLGIAHVNQDQSINVYLDALPMGGKLQIREEEVKPRYGSDTRTSSPSQPAFEMDGTIQ
jgi:hypothetical protein